MSCLMCERGGKRMVHSVLCRHCNLTSLNCHCVTFASCYTVLGKGDIWGFSSRLYVWRVK